MARLSDLLKESKDGLGSASSHIDSLKEATEKLKTELESVRGDLRTTKNSENSLKV